MVLQCPECLEQRGYGRAELLGQLAVCPSCEAVFGWKEAERERPEAPEPEAQAAPPGVRGSGAGRRRGSGAGGKRRDD